ncbi:hypothetical protein [Enterococcus faecium]|uniref:hypothetical protein n=1 Tax=Enterococcus TaxID=1350 RepID=UPI00223C21E8|nr:hypothetical protein [Enterococcus faecium]MCS8591669.1 hypothetical protein [Enterococcus faecium]
MGLLKLISNRISTEWKEKFNKNIDYLNDLEKKLSDQDKTTNSRIDNLVINSGGDSPNEVVDARVNREGATFETLQGRLLATETKQESEIAALTDRQNATAEQVDQLNTSVETIVGGSNNNFDIYVSATNGSDQVGDGTEEKPFATIQTAVNQIPLICTQVVTIWIDNGVYLEDVVVKNINASQIHIRPKDNVDDDGYTTGADRSVKVRRISFSYCSGYFRIYGLQGVDQANTSSTFYIENSGYLAVACVTCKEDTKSIKDHVAVRANAAKCHIYNSYFENQNTVIHSALLADVLASSLNNGKNNNIGMVANNATMRDGMSKTMTFATTRHQIVNSGLIIAKGQVLS